MPFANVPTLVIAGVNRPFISLASVSISRPIKGRPTAHVTVFDKAQSYRPEHGATIVMSDTGTTFAGTIDKITEEYLEETNFVRYKLECSGYAAIFDHRFVFRRYPSGSTFWDIINDINIDFLDGEGFDIANVNGFGSISAELVFDGVSVTTAFNQITDLGGEQWWVFGHSIYFKDLSSAPAAPFAITATSRNWRKLTIERARSSSYRNVQYVRTGASLAPGVQSDPAITANGTQWFFQTRFVLTSAPTITINGTPQTIKQRDVDAYPAAGYFWTKGGSGVQQGQQIPPTAGAVIVISYGSTTTNIISAKNDSEISARAAIEGGSGKWEAVDDASNIDKLAVAQQLASGLLAKSGSIPVMITYETDSAFLTQGMKQDVQLPANNIDTIVSGQPYYITQIDSQLLEAPFPDTGLYFRHKVTLSLSLDQGNWVTWWENIFGNQPSSPPVDLTKIDPASVNTTLHVDPTTGKAGVNTIDSTQLTNISALVSDGLVFEPITGKIKASVNGTEVSIDPTTKQLVVKGLSAAKLDSGTVIAAGVGYFGLVAVSQILAGDFIGFTLTLNRNGVTTSINNSLISAIAQFSGIAVVHNSTGAGAALSAVGLDVMDSISSPTVRTSVNKGGIFLLQGSSGFAAALANNAGGGGSPYGILNLYNSAGTQVIKLNNNNDGIMTAIGLVTTSGIDIGGGAKTAGLNPFIGGVQYFGRSWDLRAAVTIPPGGGTAFVGFTIDGGFSFASGVRIKGGGVVDLF